MAWEGEFWAISVRVEFLLIMAISRFGFGNAQDKDNNMPKIETG